MKTITLVRHAKSGWENIGTPDIVRPLNTRGIETSLWMGPYLYHKHIRPNLIVSSPATRALHTAINLCIGLKYPPDQIVTVSNLYLGGVRNYINQIQQIPEDIDHIMLIGHQPDISETGEYLCGYPFLHFPTCAVLTIDLEVDHWLEVKMGIGKVHHFFLPKEVSDRDVA